MTNLEYAIQKLRKLTLRMLYLLLIFCLTSCSAPSSANDPQPRILLPLTPGEHKPYVELSDGYLHFSEHPSRSLSTSVNVDVESGSLNYQEALDVLGFSLEDALAKLPERLRFTEQHLDDNVLYLSGTRETFGGYTFEIAEEGRPKFLRSRLVFRYQYKDGYLQHEDAGLFRVVPWERRDVTHTEAFIAEEYGIREYYYRSQVGEIEVGLMHSDYVLETYPDNPNEYYYAGFYVGDLAFALESHCGYCTQEEFIEVLLAIIDAAVASTE